jgi:hypothetical protein
MRTKFLLENVKEGDQSVEWRIILEWDVKKHDEAMWTEVKYLEVGSSGGCLRTR